MGVLLQAVDVAGPLRWRWVLSDEETGSPLADHEVGLESAADQVERFQDLHSYVRSYAVPDRRYEDEARFVTDAGAWAGRAVLGESVGAAIVAYAPTTVRVRVPRSIESVILWPLELAHVGGRPLAMRGDVSFVYEIDHDKLAARKAEVGEALRILAVFSQPTRTSVLALRRERRALSQLIRRIAARERAAITLKVVQYGVTRERLSAIADSGDGWDLLHLSGHGASGAFLLEKADGSPDPVSTADLVGLLRPIRRRVKLAVVSACESAVDTTAATLRLLGLTEQAEALEAEAKERSAARLPGLARALVEEFDCAAVAMRYPVLDEFAITFSDVFYERLLSRRQPVDMSVSRAVAEAAGSVPSEGVPALSLGTAGAFGSRAAGLKLPMPRKQPEVNPARQKMRHFPNEPKRFVGRASTMAAANVALAAGSGRTAVLLHGMAGGGKSACALELAYRHEDNFSALAFWQAPTREDEWQTALADFAETIEVQLREYGFSITPHIGTIAALKEFLPQLRQVMARSGVLLLMDNLETLLTPDGRWRDQCWKLLIEALASHDGESRMILTSQITPAELDWRAVMLPVHSLSLAESAVLARELPNLRRLLHAEGGSFQAATTSVAADRARVWRVLRVVQGHPKLLELADAAAADRNRLDAHLAAAQKAASGQHLEAFFRQGESALDTGEFLNALSVWTTAALRALSEPTGLMAKFVACLEDGHRRPDLVDMIWPRLWQGLCMPGEPPDPRPLLAEVADAALIQAEMLSINADTLSVGDGGAPVPGYRMHPGVTAAISAAAGADFRVSVDTELSAFWQEVARQGLLSEDGEFSHVVVQSGLAATPYLLRLGDWDTACALLQHVIMRDESPRTALAVLPTLRRVASAQGTPAASALFARVLRTVNRDEAERLSRDALGRAVTGGDYRLASGIAGDLVTLLMDAGRLEEALELAGEKAGFSTRAGQGTWTQLGAQVQRLQILSLLGEHERVLGEVEELRGRATATPKRRSQAEDVEPWAVYEGILNVGLASALATWDWPRCLDLNAQILASKRRRRARAYDIICTRFDDADPLIRLGRWTEARQLLAECQEAFEEHADMPRLAHALSTRATLESATGHWLSAADFEQAALRLYYAAAEPYRIAFAHHSLASDLSHANGSQAVQRANRLAAALLFGLIGMHRESVNTLKVLAEELRKDRDKSQLPSTLAEVIEVADRGNGIRLGHLLATLQPEQGVVDDALIKILRDAAELPDDGELRITNYLRDWEPVIAEIVAACSPGAAIPAELAQFLDEGDHTPGCVVLTGALRRILAGARDDELLSGLEDHDAAIVQQVLSQLEAESEQ
jgi:CHAT domain